MKDLETLAGFFVAAVIITTVLRIFIAVKAPNVHRVMEEMEDKRKARNKRMAAGAFKGGFSILRLFLGR